MGWTHQQYSKGVSDTNNGDDEVKWHKKGNRIKWHKNEMAWDDTNKEGWDGRDTNKGSGMRWSDTNKGRLQSEETSAEVKWHMERNGERRHRWMGTGWGDSKWENRER